MTWVAGVDGCRAGWFVVLRDLQSGRTTHAVKRNLSEVLGMRENPRIIAVDIPIGLLDHAERGGRACDRDARRMVGTRRGPGVFPPPVRVALPAASWREADAANRASSPEGVGLSRQTWAIVPKIAEVDAEIAPSDQQRVRECFPELSFARMTGTPMATSKRTVTGMQDRAEALVREGFADPRRLRGTLPSAQVAFDDILDAHACCWTAGRVFEGVAGHVPEGADAPRDTRGLAMQIWF